MRTDKIATIYWLGNDLMWIKMAVIRGFDDETIGHAIEKVIGYMIDLEADAGMVVGLEASWNYYRDNHVGLAGAINAIKWYMNDELLKVEKGFHKR